MRGKGGVERGEGVDRYRSRILSCGRRRGGMQGRKQHADRPLPFPRGRRCDDQPQKKEAIGLRDLAWPGSPRFTVIDCGLRKSAEQCRARHRTASPGGSSLSLRECKPQCTQSAGSDMSPVVRRQYYLLALWKNSEHSRIADMSRSLILRSLRGKTSDPDGIHLST